MGGHTGKQPRHNGHPLQPRIPTSALNPPLPAHSEHATSQTTIPRPYQLTSRRLLFQAVSTTILEASASVSDAAATQAWEGHCALAPLTYLSLPSPPHYSRAHSSRLAAHTAQHGEQQGCRPDPVHRQCHPCRTGEEASPWNRLHPAHYGRRLTSEHYGARLQRYARHPHTARCTQLLVPLR